MALPPHIVLHGSPKEAGWVHGEVLREQIHALFEVRMGLVRDLTQAPLNDVQDECEDILRQIKYLLPEVAEEVAATAQAANIDTWKLVLSGGFSDVLDRCSTSDGTNTQANECSLIVTTDEEGQPLLVGTWDTHGSAQDSLVSVERQIAGCPAVVSLSTAGWPMQQGVTEHGLAFAIANMGASSNYQGVSYISALPRIVTSRTAEEARLSASVLSHCSARYYLFADHSGQALGLEHEGHKTFDVSGFNAHTNHFVSNEGVKHEGRSYLVEESRGRKDLMQALFDGGKKSLPEVFSLLSTTNRDGNSIMKLGEGSLDRTCAAFAISPTKRTLWFTPGPPKVNKVQELSARGPETMEGIK